MAEPTRRQDRRERLTDKQALGLLGGWLVFRAITQRIGFGLGPSRLLPTPWAIPLLNNSSILLITAGTGAAGRPGMIVATVLASVFMSTLAGLILYWVGWRFGHRLAEMSKRPGSPWAGVWNPKQVARAERWMNKWGVPVVFFGRIIEYFTTPVIVVAGASDMRLRRFMVAHTLGAFAFAGIFLWIGGVAQERWPWLKDWIADVYGPWALRISFVLLGLLLLVFLVGRSADRKDAAVATEGAEADAGSPRDPEARDDPGGGPASSAPGPVPPRRGE